MSLFRKLKNNSFPRGPPTPPRRDDNAQCDRLKEEMGDESDDDMYEPPPCERAVTVPHRPKEENVYLERKSNLTVPRRQAPPPLPNFSKHTSGDLFLETQHMKPPDVDRTDKPGRKKMPTAPAAPQPESEEDVYLDPCEEQNSAEDLYLEPTEACPLPPRGVKMMPLPPSIKPALPSPEPLMKPPPDRLSSLTVPEFKTDPKAESRRFSKPWLPTNLKESIQDPPQIENKPGAGRKVISSSVENTRRGEWFAGNCNRKMAEDLLLSVKKDGAFLVRNSSTQTSRQPYTLAVLYQRKVYNIPIRFLDDAQGYALGKEGKKNEEVFSTLEDIVSHHRNNKLLLIDSKSQAKNTTYLTNAAHL